MIRASPDGSTRKARWTRASAVSTATRKVRRRSSSGVAAEVAGEQVGEAVGDAVVGFRVAGADGDLVAEVDEGEAGDGALHRQVLVEHGVHGRTPASRRPDVREAGGDAARRRRSRLRWASASTIARLLPKKR